MTPNPHELARRDLSVALMASMVESSDDAIVGKTLDGEILTWNRAAEKMYGYSGEEIIGKSISLLIPDGSDEMELILRRIRDGERVDHYQTVRMRKDGSRVPISLTVSPIRDESGAIIGASSTGRDITERLRSFDMQREAAGHTRSLIEASLDPLVTISAEGRITDVNEATVKVTGVGRGELIGTDFADYFTEPERARAGYRQVFAEGSVIDYPLTICHRDGRLTEVLYNASLYRDDEGGVLGVFAAARDVTERKGAERQVRTLNAELEQRVADRTEELEAFVYSVSHDLRAPLRAMDGFTHVLLDQYGEQFDERGRHYLVRLREAAKRMTTTIDELLTLSRASSATVRHEHVDVSALARAAAEELRATEPDRDVTIEIADGLAADGDVDLLRIVFANLLGNAWKFTSTRDHAFIEVGKTQDADRVTFFVRDNGIGFDVGHVDRLFKLFQRLHGVDEFPGSGIGLASVKRIVNRHGGRIWADAQLGQGATFSFTLTANRAP